MTHELDIKVTKAPDQMGQIFTLVIEQPEAGLKSEVILTRNEVCDLRNQIVEELEK